MTLKIQEKRSVFGMQQRDKKFNANLNIGDFIAGAQRVIFYCGQHLSSATAYKMDTARFFADEFGEQRTGVGTAETRYFTPKFDYKVENPITIEGEVVCSITCTGEVQAAGNTQFTNYIEVFFQKVDVGGNVTTLASTVSSRNIYTGNGGANAALDTIRTVSIDVPKTKFIKDEKIRVRFDIYFGTPTAGTTERRFAWYADPQLRNPQANAAFGDNDDNHGSLSDANRLTASGGDMDNVGEAIAIIPIQPND